MIRSAGRAGTVLEAEEEKRNAEARSRRNGVFPKIVWNTCSCVTRRKKAR